MVARIGDVWDGTADTGAARAGPLAAVAALAFWLPAAGQAALKAYAAPTPGTSALAALIALVALAVALWGQLAVIALASDPTATRAEAGRRALGRMGAVLKLALLFAAVLLAAIIPLSLGLMLGGYDFEAAGGGDPAPLSGGAACFCGLYGLVLAAAALWLMARLLPIGAVVLHERLGLGAIGRSARLTRGLTLRLIGAAALFILVWIVAAVATRSVVAVIAALLLGPDGAATATFLASLAAAAVAAAFACVVSVFAARLYAALQAERGGERS